MFSQKKEIQILFFMIFRNSEFISRETMWWTAQLFKNISITGLSTIARNGDTSFTYNEDTLALGANIGMGASKAGYSASASFQGTKENFVQIRNR